MSPNLLRAMTLLRQDTKSFPKAFNTNTKRNPMRYFLRYADVRNVLINWDTI